MGLKAQYPLEVIGHSLGGSLAVLWAQKSSLKPKRVITFGQPKVTKSKDAALSKGMNIVRIIDSTDSLADHFKDFNSVGTVIALFPDCEYGIPSADQLLDLGTEKRAEGNQIDVYLRNLKPKLTKKPVPVSKMRRSSAAISRQ